MEEQTIEDLLSRIQDLESRLSESTQLIEAIQAGEVDAFAINTNSQSEIYTLQSGDYAYRLLIEEFGEGAINVTEEGLVVYTNCAFTEMLELPYDKVIGTSMLDFVAPDSIENFKGLFASALNGKSKGEIDLAFHNKTIPVYISLTSLQPKLPTVGIIFTDLSEKKKNEKIILKYQEDLEAKNGELARNNEELASFAYIASHDLQEPLRKIQIFSSLILSKESGNFNIKTKDYFERINSASKRMQNLIKALLEYSRINTSKIVFATYDLNMVLEDVKRDLSELIEESNLVIEASPLPTLQVIPHQVEQLFSNLIINSIKYRKTGCVPILKIDAQMVSLGEPSEKGSSQRDKYWKICFNDNGIGFGQEYANKIFELFQRLHANTAYEGAGIGLAICKKIVMNHHGFIEAIGEPGTGATFNVYFPSEAI